MESRVKVEQLSHARKQHKALIKKRDRLEGEIIRHQNFITKAKSIIPMEKRVKRKIARDIKRFEDEIGKMNMELSGVNTQIEELEKKWGDEL